MPFKGLTTLFERSQSKHGGLVPKKDEKLNSSKSKSTTTPSTTAAPSNQASTVASASQNPPRVDNLPSVSTGRHYHHQDDTQPEAALPSETLRPLSNWVPNDRRQTKPQPPSLHRDSVTVRMYLSIQRVTVHGEPRVACWMKLSSL